MATDVGNWTYDGDVNLKHGGTYYLLNEQDWRWGYCTAVRVTDLDSACGFTGAVLVEHVTINGVNDRKRILDAMKCVGGLPFRGRRSRVVSAEELKRALRLAILGGLSSYGFYEPDDVWDSYRSHHTEVVQLEADGPMVFDGWKADKRMRGEDFEGYVKAVHLKD